MIDPFFKKINKEFLFQFILIFILGIVFAVERHKVTSDLPISLPKLSFFLAYAFAALIIGYILLPKFFYKKEYWRFFIGVLVVLLAVIGFEELVIEQIFYPNSRGQSFPGFIHTLIEILPTILILVGFKFGWDAQKKQSELERLNTMVAESRMQFLKSQINPHFLFNNLNNLYAYALENSPKTPKIILELSALLRYMLYDCQADYVPLTKEIKCLNDFINLQELQIENRGNIEFNILGKAENQLVAPLILIVFIENCFKHSMASLSDGIQIKIDLSIDQQQLKLRCSNTFSPNGNTQNLAKGIGLENVQSRLNLLYPAAHTLAVKRTNNWYEVNLTMNLINAIQ